MVKEFQNEIVYKTTDKSGVFDKTSDGEVSHGPELTEGYSHSWSTKVIIKPLTNILLIN